jgi:excisionase family DNA binding protein
MADFPHSSESFEPFLDSEQAAALVRIHPKTLQRLARIGRVHGYRIGKLWRFRASDLACWSGETGQMTGSCAMPMSPAPNCLCPQPSKR